VLKFLQIHDAVHDMLVSVVPEIFGADTDLQNLQVVQKMNRGAEQPASFILNVIQVKIERKMSEFCQFLQKNSDRLDSLSFNVVEVSIKFEDFQIGEFF